MFFMCERGSYVPKLLPSYYCNAENNATQKTSDVIAFKKSVYRIDCTNFSSKAMPALLDNSKISMKGPQKQREISTTLAIAPQL